MSGVFTTERSAEPMYRVEMPNPDGTRTFKVFARESVVPAWEAIGCVATRVSDCPTCAEHTHGGAK